MKPAFLYLVGWGLFVVIMCFGVVLSTGMVVHDSAKPAFQDAPQCPTNYVPDFWGVVEVQGQWAPVYRCTPSPDGRTAPNTQDPATWQYPAPATTNQTVP